MRRMIMTILALSVAAGVYAQQKIQDTFFGLRFGDRYEDIYKHQEIKQHTYVVVPGYRGKKNKPRQQVTLYHVDFGGRNWAYMDYYFSPKGVFYKVRVYKNYDSLEDAEKRYLPLMKDLDMKYGEDKNIVREVDDCIEDDREMSVTYTDADGRICKLRIYYTESEGMDMYYYVMLNYYDGKLREKVEAEFLNEF